MTSILQRFKAMAVDSSVRYPGGTATVMLTGGPSESNDPTVMIQDTSFKFSELEALVKSFKIENQQYYSNGADRGSFTAHLCFYEHNGLELAKSRYRSILKRLNVILDNNIAAGGRGSCLDLHDGMYSVRIHILAGDLDHLLDVLVSWNKANKEIKYIGVCRDGPYPAGVKPSSTLMPYEAQLNSPEREKISKLVDCIHVNIEQKDKS